ncbi:unnamed protein product, partial [Pylaiella littoralis]
TLVSVAPAVSVVFDLGGRTESALRLITVGVIVLCFAVAGTFLVCGKSLVRAIDESIRQQQPKLLEGNFSAVDENCVAAVGGSLKPSTSVANAKLPAARRKVKIVITFAV